MDTPRALTDEDKVLSCRRVMDRTGRSSIQAPQTRGNISTSQFIKAEVLESIAGEKFCTTKEMISWKGQASDGLTTAASYLITGLATSIISSLLSVETIL
jgi:hypothetical protein